MLDTHKYFMKILVTGCCGFIGYHLSKRLIKDGHFVTGVDNMNDYYDVSMKERRLVEINGYDNFKFYLEDISNYEKISKIFESGKFDIVVNLAAQAGVRYSIENPFVYIQSNLVGFSNILECCRSFKVDRLIYASSSSVYGNNDDIPFKECTRTDNPVSLYAATKKSNEILAESYSTLYGFQCTGLRFFTVYGPEGRPDMAPFLFTKAIDNGEPITVFNNGNMLRDFTYIDDIVEGIVKIIEKKLDYRHEIYNIGCSNPVKLMDFINEIEKCLGKKANIVFKEMQKGDVVKTYADTTKLEKDFGYKPSIKIEEGIEKFINWWKEYE